MKIWRYSVSRKQAIIVGGILIVLILLGIRGQYNKYQDKKQAELNLMHTVGTGNLHVDVKVTANAKLVDEQNLSFGQEGKITKVYVSVGDEVAAGDVLAELDMDNYYNSIQTAELELANARIGLQKLINNDTSVREAQVASQLNETRASLQLEQEQYSILKSQLASSLQQQKDSLDKLRREYDLSRKSVELGEQDLATDGNISQSRRQTINDITSTLFSAHEDAEYAIETIDQIFGVSTVYANSAQSYNSKLSTKNTFHKRETESKIRQAYTFINLYESKLKSINEQSSDTYIYNTIQDFYDDTEILDSLMNSARDALENTTPGSVLTETMLDTFIASTASARSTVTSLRSQIQGLATNVTSMLTAFDTEKSSLKTLEQSIKLLESDIPNMEQNHLNQLARQQSQINTLTERIDVLQTELNDLYDGADAYDLQQQENLIRQAELRLDRVNDQKDDYQIIADFDGRVRTVDVIEGEQYELDDRKFIVVENPNLIELELQVSQIDIVKIKEGDPVVVTFDAYPNNPIEASISNRNVNPQPNGRGGVYYEAVILLEKQELEILAGMSALVTVTTNTADNVLIVPTLAVIHKEGKTYVQRKEEKEWKLHPVTVGIQNNFQAEIIEGLQEGDIIKASVLEDDLLEEMGIDDQSNSMFGG